MQARAAYKGMNLQNEAAPWIAEYAQRKRLAKLGYTTNVSELCALKAEIFGIIDVELDKCQSEDMRSRNGRK
jgi:hypothetical protein